MNRASCSDECRFMLTREPHPRALRKKIVRCGIVASPSITVAPVCLIHSSSKRAFLLPDSTARRRGSVALGNPKIDKARQMVVAEIVDRADQRAANVIPIVRQIQRSGATPLRQIAEALNARGISAPRGGQWHATSVRNVMARA